ncbi:alpha/beta hydrolase fold domain-containing protein [Staphylococcus lugdunensis]|uniref:alpha/beta hydrolase fold domain-containing protein n=1 Tax=Staphylococcus lugdunensis TaxID=28035 RepID=UPI001F55EADB|nr:alpha/beta hydrolase [Staphylococcus lugdunensis]MCI2759231.1 alpha/beta hydrolase [Staphylococcus lugdunensis]MCI2793877.1 alpha/beta hydrolase [Staphylococcus lugdunensis]MCI2795908.1 alpha/beta hydrolase [Staphylococcus lugdunensis]
MRTYMMNRVVNKYLLHNRSIQFKDEGQFNQFMEKRRNANRLKHKQPSTLNVKSNLDKLMLDDMQVFRFNFRHETGKKILYLHGGYNTLQPSPFHWRLMDKLTLATLYEVVLPIYPKAPEFHIDDTFKAIQAVYVQLVDEVGAENIVVMGDGTGGALALSFVQSLIKQQLSMPRKLYLLSPLLDATLSNPEITEELQQQDQFVNRQGVHDILSVWAAGKPLNNAEISPINGNLEGLPPIVMFGAGKEIYYPDMERLDFYLSEQRQPIEFFRYPKMIHDFSLFPIHESHKVVKQIAQTIDNDLR